MDSDSTSRRVSARAEASTTSQITNTLRLGDPAEGEYGCEVLYDPRQVGSETNGDVQTNQQPSPTGQRQTLEIVADIVFIHGLTGNRRSTWTRDWIFKGRKETTFWPKELLPGDVKDVRVLTWGYDADVVQSKLFRMASNNDIKAHAINLCTDLANMRTACPERPIIFVVHSLGGLVCKAALLHSSELNTKAGAHIHKIHKFTAGIVFMGTPHRGSPLGKPGGVLTGFVNLVTKTNKDIVKSLEKDAKELQDLQERFYILLNNCKEDKTEIKVICFYEEKDTPAFGIESATMLGYEPLGINETHSGMTKFSTEESPGYVKIRHEIQRWIKAIKNAENVHERGASSTFTHIGDVRDHAMVFHGRHTFSGSTIGGIHNHNTGQGTMYNGPVNNYLPHPGSPNGGRT